MATPQDLTVTVSGRRCTRSRARTAVTPTLTSEPPAITPTELAPDATSEQDQIESNPAEDIPQAPPPASPPQENAAEASPTSEPAAESSADPPPAPGPPARASELLNLAPTPPAAAAPDPGALVSEGSSADEVVETSAAAQITTAPEADSTPVSSDDSDLDSAVPSSPVSASPASATAPADPSSGTDSEEPEISAPASPSEQPADNQPQPLPSSTGTDGSMSGVIAPDTSPENGNGLTLSSGGATNVGAIVGGVVGGVASIALISVLLFLCLRRKRRPREPLREWREKGDEEKKPGLLAGLKVIPEKLKAIPNGMSVMVGKMKGKKAGSLQNPYNRQSVRSSISSVYSVRSNGRSRSISEPPSKFRQQLRGFGDRMPSLKRSRTLLQNQDNQGIGTQPPFPGIPEDAGAQNNRGIENPFADPEPSAAEQVAAFKAQRSLQDGLKDQQRGPITPKAAVIPHRNSKDPFASILDEIEERNGSGTPEWLKDSSHKRTQSATAALHSHPPSSLYTNSVYTNADNPFIDPSEIPPMPPRQQLPPDPPTRPSNTYTSTLPTFDALSTNASRDSDGSFFFGEPGPSRPTTDVFSNVSVLPKTGRESDPFDLDRPEVLGFGSVSAHRQVRGSVTRQNSRSNRTSSVPNWVNLDDNPYDRAKAVPGPLRNPSLKR